MIANTRMMLVAKRWGKAAYPLRLRGAGPLEFVRMVGDHALLDHPLTAFFCSVRCPGNLVIRALDWIAEMRDCGEAIVSGFHSPVEREALKTLLRGKSPIVACPARDIEGMRLPADWRDAIAAGRMLVVSAARPGQRRMTAETAAERNGLVVALAERVVVVHAEPGGRLEAFVREAVAAGRRVESLP